MKIKRNGVIGFVVASIVMVGSIEGGQGKTATIRINVDSNTGRVNRDILGSNIIAYNTKYDQKGVYGNRGAGVWSPEDDKPIAEYVRLARLAGVSMLRWPGGSQSKELDWKNTIGPKEKRPRQQFGLPEFMRFCAAVGADPVITLADETGTEGDAADLVEYLNAPLDAGNPNGGIDWATIRVRDGRKEPWDVKWYELGNETFYSKMPVGDYIKKYEDYQSAMKEVDPAIKLGAVFEDSANVDSGWTYSILNKIGNSIDFAVIHPYVLGASKESIKLYSSDQVAQAAVSADAKFMHRLENYRAAISSITGRDDLPLIASEYNGLFVQEKPLPFRHTLANALHNADLVRIMLMPEWKIEAAMHWQLSNSYWGIIRGYKNKGERVTKQVSYYVYELYNRYLGDILLNLEIESDSFEFYGAVGIGPRIGEPSKLNRVMKSKEMLPSSWSRLLFLEGSQTQKNGVLIVEFNQNKDMNYHHAKKVIPVEPGTLYKISIRVRTTNIKNGKVGIEVQDVRGWAETRSLARNIILTGTKPWTWVTTEYRTLPDAREIKVLARRYPGHGTISGKAEFGELKVEKIDHNSGAVQSVVGTASKSEVGDKAYLVLINKDLHDSIEATLFLKEGFKVSKSESLIGATPYATNLDPSKPLGAKIEPIKVDKIDEGVFKLNLPSSSVTGIEFKSLISR